MNAARLARRTYSYEMPHIGPRPQPGRAMLVASLLLVLGVCWIAYSLYWHRYDEAAMHRLQLLQAEHDLRCDTPAYPEASSDLVRTLYLGSPVLQHAVDEQLVNLKMGVPCEEVDRLLRAAEFPLTSIESIPAANRPPLRIESKPARP